MKRRVNTTVRYLRGILVRFSAKDTLNIIHDRAVVTQKLANMCFQAGDIGTLEKGRDLRKLRITKS